MLSTRHWACSRFSTEFGDELAGTASVVNGYLLIEHGGPWGRKVLQDAVFTDPDGAVVPLGGQLDQTLKPLGVTTLLVRRLGSGHGIPAPTTVMLVALDARGGTGARRSVDAVSEIAGWDLPALLAQLRSGEVPAGWEPMERQYLVCTHARRDACCGELGRPVAAAFRDLAPEHTWEASHVGGHRLASNALVLPEGFSYGRLEPRDAEPLIAAHGSGRLLLDSLRGRAALPQPVQAAEIALRKQIADDDGAAPVELVEAAAEEGQTRTVWAVGEQRWRVVIDTLPGEGPPRPTSCAAVDSAPPVRRVVSEVVAL